ncbi:MAG: DUF3857 domain-containing protein [Ectothiorhodospiraceae bacterium]|nr:DUF3857 domain-containing protein [Ectothiorhodospiraceae bacterium]
MSIRRIVPVDQAEWSVAPPPPWRIPRDIDWRFRAPADAAVAWLLVDEQHHVASQACARRWVRQLLSISAVQALAQVELEFEPDSQRLVVHELVVWRLDPDGTWRKRAPVDAAAFLLRQREQQLEQQMLNGRVSLVALLEDVRVGDVVDLAWTIEPRERLPGLAFTTYFAFAWRVPVARVRVALHLGADVPVRWRLHPGGDGPSPAEHATATLVEWAMDTPPVFEGESNVPGSHWHWPFLEVSGWTSWREVARFVSDLWSEAVASGSDAVGAEATRLAAGNDTEQAILGAIRFVQEEVRYLAVDFGHGAGLLPCDAGTVLRRRFGDCKDKAVLLTALLRAMGVDARPVLVAGQWREAVGRLMPSAYAFDHAIVGLEWNGTRHFVDPTVIGQRGDLAHRMPPPHGVGLAITAETTTLVELAPASAPPSTVALTELFSLDRRGRGHVEQALEVSGGFADDLRATLLRDGRQAFARSRAEALQQRFPALEPDVDTTSFVDDGVGNVLQMQARHALPTWGRPEAKPPASFGYGAYGLLLGLDAVDDRETRRQPWALRFPMTLRHRVVVRGRCVRKAKPSRFEHHGPGFRFRCDVQSRRHEVRFDYLWETTSSTVTAADWPAYRAERETALEHTGALVDTQGLTVGRAVRRGLLVALVASWVGNAVMRDRHDGPPEPGRADRVAVERAAGAAFDASRSGDFARAHALLEPLMRYYRDNLDVQCLWAEASLRTGHFEDAEAGVARARELEPDKVLPRQLEAALAEARGDFAGARATLDALAQRPGVDPRVLVDRARIVERLGDRAGARTAWEQVLARQPAQPDALYSLAHLLWQDGERQRADAVIAGTIRALPTPSPVLETALSRYYSATGRHRLALDAAERAAGLAPDDPMVAHKRTMAQLGAGEREQALASASAMTARFPDDPLAWSALATAAAVTRHYEAAGPAFERWLALAPTDPNAHSSRGFFLHVTGDDIRARAALAKGVELFPAHGTLWLNYAVVLESLGDPAADEARRKATALLTPEDRATLIR